MDITLTFLGTSNAIPTAARNHPAIHLSYNGDNLLIDCGEGTQRQFKKANINPCKLTHVLITHLHGDHVLGLPGLMETLEMSEYARTLKIYGPSGIKNHFNMLEKAYRKFNISYEVHENVCPEEKAWFIESKPMTHTLPTNAYAFIVKDKRHLDKTKIRKLKLPNSPILKELQLGHDITFNNKKIKAKDITYLEKGKKIAIVLDTKFNENAITLAKDADLLICEATYAASEEEYASEYKHLTSQQAATIAKKAKVKKLALTHISQRYEQNLSIIEKEAKKIFKSTIIPKDLEILTI